LLKSIFAVSSAHTRFWLLVVWVPETAGKTTKPKKVDLNDIFCAILYVLESGRLTDAPVAIKQCQLGGGFCCLSFVQSITLRFNS